MLPGRLTDPTVLGTHAEDDIIMTETPHSNRRPPRGVLCLSPLRGPCGKKSFFHKDDHGRILACPIDCLTIWVLINVHLSVEFAQKPRVNVYVTVLALPNEDNATTIDHARCAVFELLLNLAISALSNFFLCYKCLPLQHSLFVVPNFEALIGFRMKSR